MTASRSVAPDFFAKNAQNSAAPGMPGEEEIARAISSLRKHMRPDSKLPDILPSEMAQAAAVLSLIRPAFEAKEREIRAERLVTQKMRELAARQKAAGKAYYDRALSAEAKLAQAVEALNTAAENIEHWGSYASSYLQEKHGLKDDIASARSASAAARGETSALASVKEKP